MVGVNIIRYLHGNSRAGGGKIMILDTRSWIKTHPSINQGGHT